MNSGMREGLPKDSITHGKILIKSLDLRKFPKQSFSQCHIVRSRAGGHINAKVTTWDKSCPVAKTRHILSKDMSLLKYCARALSQPQQIADKQPDQQGGGYAASQQHPAIVGKLVCYYCGKWEN